MLVVEGAPQPVEPHTLTAGEVVEDLESMDATTPPPEALVRSLTEEMLEEVDRRAEAEASQAAYDRADSLRKELAELAEKSADASGDHRPGVQIAHTRGDHLLIGGHIEGALLKAEEQGLVEPGAGSNFRREAMPPPMGEAPTPPYREMREHLLRVASRYVEIGDALPRHDGTDLPAMGTENYRRSSGGAVGRLIGIYGFTFGGERWDQESSAWKLDRRVLDADLYEPISDAEARVAIGDAMDAKSLQIAEESETRPLSEEVTRRIEGVKSTMEQIPWEMKDHGPGSFDYDYSLDDIACARASLLVIEALIDEEETIAERARIRREHPSDPNQ